MDDVRYIFSYSIDKGGGGEVPVGLKVTLLITLIFQKIFFSEDFLKSGYLQGKMGKNNIFITPVSR